jgi:hypothetical protein
VSWGGDAGVDGAALFGVELLCTGLLCAIFAALAMLLIILKVLLKSLSERISIPLIDSCRPLILRARRDGLELVNHELFALGT